MLSKTKVIEEIELSNFYHFTDDDFDLCFVDLSVTKKINLIDTNITFNSLGLLLSKTKELKKLDLSNCYNLTDINFYLIPVDLAALEDINLHNTNITFNNLKWLLSKTKNLKKLDLSNCKNLADDELYLRSSDLSALEEINLHNTNLTTKSLSSLLLKTKNLKKLDLSNCKNLDDADFDSNSVDLSKLEEINLSDTSLTPKSLSSLLLKTKNLKKLDFSNCKNLTDVDFDSNLLDLSTLEEINLSNTNLTTKSLSSLLLKTKNLKKLSLSNCKNLDDADFDSNSVDLSKLEETNLDDTNLTIKSLISLLSKTKNLKKLDLKYYETLDDDCSNLETMGLSELKEINLRFSNISSTNLIRLLANPTALEILDLTGCINLNLPKKFTANDLLTCLIRSRTNSARETKDCLNQEIGLIKNTAPLSTSLKKLSVSLLLYDFFEQEDADTHSKTSSQDFLSALILACPNLFKIDGIQVEKFTLNEPPKKVPFSYTIPILNLKKGALENCIIEEISNSENFIHIFNHMKYIVVYNNHLSFNNVEISLENFLRLLSFFSETIEKIKLTNCDRLVRDLWEHLKDIRLYLPKLHLFMINIAQDDDILNAFNPSELRYRKLFQQNYSRRRN